MPTIATPADLKSRWPEFTAISDPVIQVALDDADEEINADAWGTRAVKAECALAAHLLKQRGVLNTGASGGLPTDNIASAKVGDVSVTYNTAAVMMAVQAGADPSLATTKYGLEYIRLMNTVAGQFTAEVT